MDRASPLHFLFISLVPIFHRYTFTILFACNSRALPFSGRVFYFLAIQLPTNVSLPSAFCPICSHLYFHRAPLSTPLDAFPFFLSTTAGHGRIEGKSTVLKNRTKCHLNSKWELVDEKTKFDL